MLGSSVPAPSASSFWADMDDHGTEKLERGSQILVPRRATGTGRAGVGLLFHSSASGVTSEGNELQSLPGPGERRMETQLVQMLLHSHCLKSSK